MTLIKTGAYFKPNSLETFVLILNVFQSSFNDPKNLTLYRVCIFVTPLRYRVKRGLTLELTKLKC